MATAGSYNEALAVAEEAKEQAKALDWPSLIAAAQLRHGSVLESLGRYGEAEDEFKEGYFNAAESGAWEVAGAAALRLVSRVAREEDGLLRHPSETGYQ